MTVFENSSIFSSLGVALVGYGSVSQVFHAPLISANNSLRLTTVVSSKPDSVHRDLPGVRVEPSLDAVLADPNIDLAVVATPNATHFSIAERLLKAGKHTLVDKPFTVRENEARALAQLAAARGLVLAAFHNRRWDADFLTLQQLVAGGRLGELQTLESSFNRFRPQPRDRWREQPGSGSGLLYDLGPHLIDQAVQLFGMPDAIWADLACQRPGAQVDDYFHLVMKFGERRAILHASMMVAGPSARFAAHGSKASYVKTGLDPQEDALKAGLTPGGPGWGVEEESLWGELTTPGADSMQRERIPSRAGCYPELYQRLYEAIALGKRSPVTAREACQNIALLEAALESNRVGARIDL